MQAGQVRELSSVVQKDDQFFVALFEEGTNTPALLTKILSGHPMRGTLSLDTEAELGPSEYAPASSARRWAQFYRPGSTSPAQVEGREGLARYVFLAYPGEDSAPVSPDPSVHWAHQHPDGAIELPDAFLAASEQGWLARSRAKARTCACSVPYARASLCDV